MDIVIGATPPGRYYGKKEPSGSGQVVEARLLGVRSPRKKQGTPPVGQKERRTARRATDPSDGRVLVLLVPDGCRIPRDLGSGKYKVMLRFVPC